MNTHANTSTSFAILWTACSSNAKTGPMPVSTTAKTECAPDCAFMGNGCYAEGGPLGQLWKGMTAAGANSSFANGRGTVRTVDWSALCKNVRALYPTQVWRHNQAGDLPHINGRIVADLVAHLVKANEGKRGFTYTHHNVLQSDHNRAVVKAANEGGFVINLSGNNLQHADMLADLQIAPVVTVLPSAMERKSSKGEWVESLEEYRARTNGGKTVTPKGRTVSVCPATYRDDVTCNSCKLCAVGARLSIVGFPSHGASKKRADAASLAA